MKLAIIAAMTEQRVIGMNNSLPWKLSEDLRRFKALTMGHPIIMGRKTWESLPKKPLPGRPNIVLSRTPGYSAEGAEVFGTLKQAVGDLAPSHSMAFVIGGAALFSEALPVAEILHLTLIHHDFKGDVSFPEFNRAAWKEQGREEGKSEDGWSYEFIDLVRA